MPKHTLKLNSMKGTPTGTLMMTKTTNALNEIRKHYWEA
jgi:hypothetical protein